MYVNFYGRFYGKVDACANGVYQALSPPLLKGPGDEANKDIARCNGWMIASWPTYIVYYVILYVMLREGGRGV